MCIPIYSHIHTCVFYIHTCASHIHTCASQQISMHAHVPSNSHTCASQRIPIFTHVLPTYVSQQICTHACTCANLFPHICIPIFILQAPPNLHPFVLEGLVRTKTFFTLLLGVVYSVSKSESSSSSEVRNYDHHRWETNKQIITL